MLTGVFPQMQSKCELTSMTAAPSTPPRVRGSWTQNWPDFVLFPSKLLQGCKDQSGLAGCRSLCCPLHQTLTDDLVVFIRWNSHMKLKSSPNMIVGLYRENYKCNSLLKLRHFFHVITRCFSRYNDTFSHQITLPLMPFLQETFSF